MNQTRLEMCRDGSHTVFAESFGQFYHNPNGAVAESRHIFFKISGIKSLLQDHLPLNILEVGFGTGLNALLLADLVAETGSQSTIHFQSVEAYPLLPSLVQNLNYRSFLAHPAYADPILGLFDTLQHRSASVHLSPRFRLDVHRGPFDTLAAPSAYFNRIFHDPFSPRVNAELWTASVFTRIRNWSVPDAVLTTYCAATHARAALAIAGWCVARAPGALGKWEMTIASPSDQQLGTLPRLDVSRLSERFATDRRVIGDSD